MSTTITESISSSASSEIELAPVLGEQFQLSWQAALLVGWFALLFLLSSHTPLAVDGDTWSHTNAGQWMFRNRSLSSEIARVPLATGMPRLHTTWLFDAFSGFVASQFGVRGMCAATSIISSAAIWLWSWQFLRASRSNSLTLISTIVLGVVGSALFSVFNSRIFDGLLLGLLFALVWPRARTQKRTQKQVQESSQKPQDSGEDIRSVHFLRCFALFAVWANVSTTFVIGLVALLAIAIGKCISEFNSRGLRGLIADKARSWVWLLQLSVIATLLTPHGLRLWTYLLTKELNSVLAGVAAGRGLYAPSMQGVVTLMLVGFVASKLARRQTDEESWFAVETALLIAFGFCLLIDVSHFYCFAATCLLLLASLAPPRNAIRSHEPTENQPLRFAGTLFALLFVWCGFALSPLSVPFLGGQLRSAEGLHGDGAPWSVVNHLQKKSDASSGRGYESLLSVPPAGLVSSTTHPFVFAPAYWADWIMFTGPQEFEFFANRDFDVLPRRVQADYQRVFRGENGWDRILDRYAVTTLVLDRGAQARLSASAKRNASWELVVETPSVLTFERKSLEGSGS